MIRHTAFVRHAPDQGSYGDCFRVSVASILDIEDAATVPHFADGGVDGVAAIDAFSEWLSTRGMMPLLLFCDGVASFDELLSGFGCVPTPYLVWGETSDGGVHCVICCGDKLLHDVAMMRAPLVRGCGVQNEWIVIFIGAKLDVTER